MKMKYQKPLVAVEHYKLSQSIAACAIQINSLDNVCVRNDDDTPQQVRDSAFVFPELFSTPCEENAAHIQDNDSICYHTAISACFTS